MVWPTLHHHLLNQGHLLMRPLQVKIDVPVNRNSCSTTCEISKIYLQNILHFKLITQIYSGRYPQ
jgi:hypothetical protein